MRDVAQGAGDVISEGRALWQLGACLTEAGRSASVDQMSQYIFSHIVQAFSTQAALFSRGSSWHLLKVKEALQLPAEGSNPESSISFHVQRFEGILCILTSTLALMGHGAIQCRRVRWHCRRQELH